MTDREHIQTMLTVARRYWLEQATQAEIAADLCSRSAVKTGSEATILALLLRMNSHV
jgi:hypothetical protein